MEPIRRPLVFCGIALMLLAAHSGAQSGERTPQDTLADWQQRLRSTSQLLDAADWAAAEEQSRALLGELVTQLKAGESSAALLAASVAQLALAEAGLGRMADAIWNWQLAQNLNPGFRERGVGSYGIASERLDQGSLRGWNQPPVGRPVESLLDPAVSPPKILHGPSIVFRASEEVLREFPRDLSVEVIVGVDGRAYHPVIRGSLINPAPVAVSLDVLREWRFEPATKNGVAVPVFLYLPLPLTEGAVEGVQAALAEEPEG